MKKFFTFLLLFVSLAAMGQIARPDSKYLDGSFLNLPSDLRSTAMGFTTAVSPSHAFHIYSNPSAAILNDRPGGVGYCRTRWGENDLHTLALSFFIGQKKKYLFSIGYRFYYHGTASFSPKNSSFMNLYSEPTKEYDVSNKRSLSISYAQRFGEHFSCGITGHYAVSYVGYEDKNEGTPIFLYFLAPYFSPIYIVKDDMNESSKTFAADIFAAYQKNGWKFGASLSNFGGRIIYKEYYDNGFGLPSRINLGGSYSLASKNSIWTTSAQISTQVNPSRNTGVICGIGSEYLYKSCLALRAGCRLANKSRNETSCFTTGFGLYWWEVWAFDFSYTIANSNDNANDNKMFAISLRFL